MLAAKNGHAEVAKLLLQNGADPNPADKDGKLLYAHVQATRQTEVWCAAHYTGSHTHPHIAGPPRRHACTLAARQLLLHMPAQWHCKKRLRAAACPYHNNR